MMRIILTACLTTLLAGCAAPLQSDPKLVALLPEGAAKKILQTHLGAEWSNAPYIEKSGNCVSGFAPGFMKVERVPIAFSDIKGLNFNPTLGKLYVIAERPESKLLWTCLRQIGFKLNEDDAREVSAALKSLGACTARDRLQC
jgi:hypothetical protein